MGGYNLLCSCVEKHTLVHFRRFTLQLIFVFCFKLLYKKDPILHVTATLP